MSPAGRDRELIAKLGLRDRYNSVEAVGGTKIPFLIAHGTEDRVIPFSQGEALASKAADLYKWVPVEGGGHTGMLAYPQVRREIAGFLEAVTKEDGLWPNDVMP